MNSEDLQTYRLITRLLELVSRALSRGALKLSTEDYEAILEARLVLARIEEEALNQEQTIEA